MARRPVLEILGLLFAVHYGVHSSDILSHLKREVCMDELGCFSAGAPFFDIIERPISLLPDDREDINTKFLLYTPSSPASPQTFSNIDKSVQNILQSSFNPNKGVKIVVPGFMSRTAPEWKNPLIDALINNDGSNVFLIDWTSDDGPLYEQAVANTRVVGAEVALFIEHLKNITGIRPESVHLIGHSLGSHIAGYAGKRLKNLGRITGLDPAGPYFTGVDPVVRLDRADALFVDAIHTNVAETRFQGFGLTESIGHVDFYPNGGALQPGCKDMGHAILSFLEHPTLDAEGLHDIQCNHVRAIHLFISSLDRSNCKLLGRTCDSWENFAAGKCGTCSSSDTVNCVPLGIHAHDISSSTDKSRSRNLYLTTTENPPYCQ